MPYELILVVSAFLTAALSGTIGMGGGIILLVVMANFFPAAVLIPLHGLVQLFSNSSRMLMHWSKIVWSIAIPSLFGSILGALVGMPLVMDLPEKEFKVILAIFILALTWMPKIKALPKIKGKFFALGFVSSFLALFIGATGPLLAPFFLHENLSKEKIVATKAICQAIIHSLKILVFFYLGFQFWDYVLIFSLMVLAVIAGTYCGKLILGKINEQIFLWIFRFAITVLCLRMLLLALF